MIFFVKLIIILLLSEKSVVFLPTSVKWHLSKVCVKGKEVHWRALEERNRKRKIQTDMFACLMYCYFKLCMLGFKRI